MKMLGPFGLVIRLIFLGCCGWSISRVLVHTNIYYGNAPSSSSSYYYSFEYLPSIRLVVHDEDDDDDEDDTSYSYHSAHETAVVDNTVVTLISTGYAHKTFVLERCVRSLRTSGHFAGPILVLTDQNGVKRYRSTLLRHDPNIILVTPKDRDMTPRSSSSSSSTKNGGNRNGNGNGEVIRYAQTRMIYKRFKTLLPEYLDDHPSLLRHRYILYMDIDNVVADKIEHLLESFETAWENITSISKSSSSSSSSSFVAQFQDPGQHDPVWHTGVILMDRYRSRHCLRLWRHTMDTRPDIPLDQQLWLKTLNESSSSSTSSCTVVPLPVRHNFAFPDQQLLEWRNRGHEGNRYPVFVHITNTRRVSRIPSEVQTAFLQEALHVVVVEEAQQQQQQQQQQKNGNNNNNNKLMMMTDSISWRDVATVQQFRYNERRKRKGLYYVLQLVGYYGDDFMD
jgi:hypothetical protein